MLRCMETNGDVAGRVVAIAWLGFLSLLLAFDQFVAGPIEADNLLGVILFPIAAVGIGLRVHWAALLPPIHGIIANLVLKPVIAVPALVGMAIPTTLWLLFFFRMRTLSLERAKAKA